MTHSEDRTLRVTPGFVDAHTHLRSTSYHEHGIRGITLEEALLRMTAMTAVDIETDVFVACSELIAKGVTAVQMMFHTFGDSSDYLSALDQTLAGITRSGIRALVVLGTTDSAEFLPPGHNPTDTIPNFAVPQRRLKPGEYADVVQSALARHPEANLGVGPVGPQWCSDELLHLIGDISQQGLRVHSHFAESRAQRYWAGDLLSRMARAQLLGPSTSLAHAVWLNPSEMDELHDRGVSLVTCPLSNHLLRAGVADVTGWQTRKIPFGVGLDSADRDQQPMTVARRALPEPDAVHALTTGGYSATGINTTRDEVVWSDDTLLSPLSVTISGKTLVRDGTLISATEVEEARQQIADTMVRDLNARENRHQILDDIMPRYLETIAGNHDC